MISRLLKWMQHHFPFIADDAYPTFTKDMDEIRLNSQSRILKINAETENWLSSAMKEQGR